MKKFLAIMLGSLMFITFCAFATSCKSQGNKNDKDVGSEWDDEYWTDNY